LNLSSAQIFKKETTTFSNFIIMPFTKIYVKHHVAHTSALFCPISAADCKLGLSCDENKIFTSCWRDTENLPFLFLRTIWSLSCLICLRVGHVISLKCQKYTQRIMFVTQWKV